MAKYFTTKNWYVECFFYWPDMWVGAYYNQESRVLYICPLPMLVLKIFRRIKLSENQVEQIAGGITAMIEEGEQQNDQQPKNPQPAQAGRMLAAQNP
jgi:hypothetical protein